VFSSPEGQHIENISVEGCSIVINYKPIADIIVPDKINGELYKNLVFTTIIKPKENITIKSFEGYIIYDKKMLKLTNITSNVSIKYNDSNGMFIADNLNSTTPVEINFTFNIINVGNTTIELKNVKLADITGAYEIKNSNVTKVIIPGPDLVIENITLNQPIICYQNNSINVKIKNVGERNITDNFTVSLCADSQIVGKKIINGLNVGESKNITFDFMPIDIKNYTITAIVDSENKVKEINENNNYLVLTNIIATENPIVIKINPSKNLIKTDQTFVVNISLENISPKRPVKAIEGKIFYNKNVLKCENFSFLITPISENLTNISINDGYIYFSIVDGKINTSKPIAQAIFRAVDVGYSEISLGNLVVSDVNGYKFNKIITNNASIVVQGPNIKIASVSLPNKIYYRIPAEINITIVNDGHQDIINKSFDINLYADSETIGSITINNLKVGEKKTISFVWKPKELKNYVLVVLVDKYNIIKEENESDNKLVKIVKVNEIPIYVDTVKNNTTVKIYVRGVPIERNCSGYDVYIKFDNVNISNISAIGVYNYTIKNNIIFLTGYNFTKHGNFVIANISVINISNKSYIVIKNIKLSDGDGYPYNLVFVNNTLLPEKIKIALEGINLDSEVLNNTYIDKVKMEKIKDINLTIIPTTIDTLVIPKLENTSINITKYVIKKIKDIKDINNDLMNIKISSEKDIEKIISEIKVESVISLGFNITNITKKISKKVNNKIISEIKFNVSNLSKKGFSIIYIPIGHLKVETIKVDNKELRPLGDPNVNVSLGWFKIDNGILKITLVKDPIVNVLLVTELPTTTTYYSSGGGHHRAIEQYPGVAEDIKSEKIKELVYKSKVIVGNDVDLNLSAKYLKDVVDIINRSLEIKEDCILIGGPIANPVVKKWLWAFPVKVTNDYPGKNRGVIEKQIINGHIVILLAGSDRWGTKAAVEYFKTLDDIPDEPIFVEWKDGKAVKIEKP
ncbi:APHP domain-containing protein, partial [Methanocaldococcus villosus KIN24-T80]